jgi:hypothetical protein
VAGDRFEDVQKAIDCEWMFQALREMILIRSENPFDAPPARFPFSHRFSDQRMPAYQYS